MHIGCGVADVQKGRPKLHIGMVFLVLVHFSYVQFGTSLLHIRPWCTVNKGASRGMRAFVSPILRKPLSKRRQQLFWY